MAVRADEISSVLREQIERFQETVTAVNVGTVVEVGDGIARIHGLSGAMASELLEFPNGIMGMALNLEEESVGAVILGPFTGIKEGDQVRSTGRIIEVPVGRELVGRVVNALGQPIDGKGPLGTTKTRPVERIAPGVVLREPVDTPVQTGIKAIDSMIPIGRGQRELIIGDRRTGKTAIAIDTIINQKGQGVICVYVAIGQKASNVASVVAKLEEKGAMDYTIVVMASASERAPLKFMAPYVGTAMAEYFCYKGQEALCVYDDLTKHADAYRQMSLLLRRPPGREAYPGDVFYLHSRLLERGVKLHEDLGGGSITSLPVVETQAGDVSAYIPTNIISITDGQIFLEPDLFYSGVRPAINVGISVSRVGGNAQIKAMKKVAGKLRLEMAQYNSLKAFAQFGSELDAATQAQLARGERMVVALNQGQFQPMVVEEQVAVIFAATQGYLDKVDVDRVPDFNSGMIARLHSQHPEVLAAIRDEKDISDDTDAKLRAAIEEFMKDFAADHEEPNVPVPAAAE